MHGIRFFSCSVICVSFACPFCSVGVLFGSDRQQRLLLFTRFVRFSCVLFRFCFCFVLPLFVARCFLFQCAVISSLAVPVRFCSLLFVGVFVPFAMFVFIVWCVFVYVVRFSCNISEASTFLCRVFVSLP